MNSAQLEEYKALKNEQISNQRDLSNIFTSTLIVLSGLMGYGIAHVDKPYGKYLLFLPVFLLTAVTQIIAGKRAAIYRIGAYIETFIESNDLSINWHKNLSKLREQGINVFGLGSKGLFASLILIQLFSTFLSVYSYYKPLNVQLMEPLITYSVLLLMTICCSLFRRKILQAIFVLLFLSFITIFWVKFKWYSMLIGDFNFWFFSLIPCIFLLIVFPLEYNWLKDAENNRLWIERWTRVRN